MQFLNTKLLTVFSHWSGTYIFCTHINISIIFDISSNNGSPTSSKGEEFYHRFYYCSPLPKFVGVRVFNSFIVFPWNRFKERFTVIGDFLAFVNTFYRIFAVSVNLPMFQPFSYKCIKEELLMRIHYFDVTYNFWVPNAKPNSASTYFNALRFWYVSHISQKLI